MQESNPASPSHTRYVHFETPDYRSREFCIVLGIECFDDGAHGKHKLAQLPAAANLVGAPTGTLPSPMPPTE